MNKRIANKGNLNKPLTTKIIFIKVRCDVERRWHFFTYPVTCAIHFSNISISAQVHACYYSE
jgi:hypothetical protein